MGECDEGATEQCSVSAALLFMLAGSKDSTEAKERRGFSFPAFQLIKIGLNQAGGKWGNSLSLPPTCEDTKAERELELRHSEFSKTTPGLKFPSGQSMVLWHFENL